MKTLYTKEFYTQLKYGVRTSSSIIVPRILELFPHINSVVDFGCGSGIWLKRFSDVGKEIMGLDFGVGVNDNLEIPTQYYSEVDLGTKLILDKKYDLALSFEVAEHICSSNATTFVENLTRASDIILFSAAIPQQGGVGHINEQWPSYWIVHFENKGFKLFDILRPMFWLDSRIKFVYRQNFLLFINENISESHKFLDKYPSFNGYPLVIPDLYTLKQETAIYKLNEANQSFTDKITSLDNTVTNLLNLYESLVNKKNNRVFVGLFRSQSRNLLLSINEKIKDNSLWHKLKKCIIKIPVVGTICRNIKGRLKKICLQPSR